MPDPHRRPVRGVAVPGPDRGCRRRRHRARRAMGRRRRRLLARGPAGRGRPPRPRPRRGRRLDRGPDARRRSTSGRASTSTAAARTSSPAGSSSSRSSATAGCTASTRVPTEAVPITPRRTVALRRPAPRPRPPPVLRRPRGPRRSGRAAEAVVDTIVAIPLDGGDRPVLVSGPDFVASPRLSPDGSRLAWLEWDHPDMPWDATRLRVATDRRQTAPSASRARRRRAGRVDRPARVGAGRDAPPRQRPERLVEPVPPRRGPAARAARADGGRVRRSVLDLRSLVVRLPRPMARSSPSAVSPGRDQLFHVAARRAHRRGRAPVHGARRRARRRTAASSRWRAPDRPIGRRAVRSRRHSRRVRRPAPGEHRRRSIRRPSRARADRVPDDRRPDGARALLPADEPGVPWARTASGHRSSSCRTAARPRTR